MRELFRGRNGAFFQGTRQHLCGLAAASLCALATCGCSLTVPMPGLGGDDLPTGSIKVKSGSPFASEMDAEDWRRAKSALDTALDPQGNGASVAWSNPETGTKGSFVPLAQPFPKDDGICRSFAVVLELKGQVGRSLRSSACRRNGGDWTVGKVTPAKPAVATKPQKNTNLAERDLGTHLR